MPMIEIPPELFLEHQGVAVYRTYDEAGELSAWHYTTDPRDWDIDQPGDEGAQFDVRDLPPGVFDVNDPALHETIIRAAIATGRVQGTPAKSWAVERVVIEIDNGTGRVVEAPPWLNVEFRIKYRELGR
ncbi:MAG TPA: hypothetical protein VGD99_29460 [Anaerolineae bacterium]